MSWEPFRRTGVALYPFEPNGDYQVPLKQGDKVEVLEHSSGWYKGTVLTNPPLKGIFPASFVQLSPEVPATPPPPPQTSQAADIIQKQKQRIQEEKQRLQAQKEALETANSKTKILQAGKVNSAKRVGKFKPLDSSTETSKPAVNAIKTVSGATENKAKPPPPAKKLSLTNDREEIMEMSSTSRIISKPEHKHVNSEDMSQVDEDENELSVDALMNEISSCIKEWSANMNAVLQSGNAVEYHSIKERMSMLLFLRAKLLRQKADKRTQMRHDIIKLIESSRKLKEGYMVPRNADGEMADANNTGVIELLRLHRSMYSTLQEESNQTLRVKASRRRQTSVAAQRPSHYTENKSAPFPPGNLQLLVDVKMCIFAVGEATEIYLRLYSKANQRFITEDYVVNITEHGLPERKDLIGNMKTCFKDLTAADFASDLYLVVFIYRDGRLVYDPKKKQRKDGSRNHRRPYGCSVLCLSEQKLGNSLDTEISPNPIPIYMPREEDQFPKLHEVILADSRSLEEAPKAKGVVVGLTLRHGEASRFTEMAENMPIPVCKKFDFPEVMTADYVRNDFYIFLLFGQFLQDKKTAQKNIEIMLQVRDQNGNLIPNCISRGCEGSVAPQQTYLSTVYYHNNNPRYNEVLRLDLSPEVFEQCHLFFLFWHVSTNAKKSQPFAFGYLKLATDTGAVIRDDCHEVFTFKPFNKIETQNDGHYLKNPAANEARKESFTVRTKLSSTQKTQNDTLHSLFKWRKLELMVLQNHLKQFLNIDRGEMGELAKFVRETFDVLFSLLVSPDHQLLREDVFMCIVHALTLLTNRKIAKYVPIVNTYLEQVFQEPTAFHNLLSLSIKRFQQADKSNPDADIFKLAKCLNYILKFLVRSRNLDLQRDNPSVSQAEFEDQMQVLFQQMCEVLNVEQSKESRFLLACQTTFVRSFPEYVEDLACVFTPAKLGMWARDMIEAIPHNDKQHVNKLNLVRLLLDGPIGLQPEAFRAVFPVMLQAQSVYLRRIDTGSLNEPYLCIAILQRLLDIVQGSEDCDVNQFLTILSDVVHVVLIVQEQHLHGHNLKPPSETVKQLCKVDMLVDSTTVILTMLHSITSEKLIDHIQTIDVDSMETFVESLLALCRDTLAIKVFPEMWVVMNMLEMSIVSKVLKCVAEPIKCKLGVATDHFAHNTWLNYFNLSLALLTTEILRLEKFSDSKKEFVMSRHGDIRIDMTKHLRDMWASLGSRQVEFIGELVGPLFEMAQNSDLADGKELAMQMYFDMIATEHKETGEFSTVERYTIDSLYNIANISQASGDRFMDLLNTIITERLESANGQFKADAAAFLGHVHKMYALMSSLLKFPNTALYEDERTSVALKLMKYLEETGHKRKEMSSRYVQYLVNLHLGLGNHIEAGMTLLYQIKMLDWTDEKLDASDNYPVETERARKDRLYKLAIDYFKQGEAYERAIELCEQLRQYHLTRSYDYKALAQVLRDEAVYFEKIVDTNRFYSSYFRVVFYGPGFNEDIRDKEFIYRGVRLEPVMDFTNRIKRKFPTAEILMSSDAPSDDKLQAAGAKGQIISITTLTPCKYRTLEEAGEEVKEDAVAVAPPPENIAKYHESNDIIIFSYAKAEQRAKEKKPANEFKDLYVAKSYIEAEESFPTNRRRVAVRNRKKIILSPIENAVSTIIGKNNELKEAAAKVANAPAGQVDVGPLSMNLNGMIDAAVNGGTSKYMEAFLSDEYVEQCQGNAEALQYVKTLKEALMNQLDLLDQGLEVFGSRCGEALHGLLEHLMATKDSMSQQTRQALERVRV